MTGPAKRIALVALSPWKQGELFLSFNMACRRLHASLLSDPRLAGSQIEVFESGAIPLRDWVERVEAFEPDMLAASAYLWSLPSFALLAERLKKKRPDCLTVFGGPSARPNVLDLAPYESARRYIDVLALGEGEHLIVELAARGMRPSADYRDLPGLALPSPLGWRKTPAPAGSLDLNTLPSPYLMDLVQPGATAYLETFRGCPMSCKFCQWGTMDASQGVLSAELIEAELRAIAVLDPVGVAIVDAGLNLNKRAFRNLVEAEARTGALAGRYLDLGVYPSLLTDEHVEFISHCRARVGLGLQTTNPEALAEQARRFKPRFFESAVERLADVSDVTVEVIMGLPGDTLEGFKETMRRVSDLSCSIRVYQCLILPDALLTEYAGDSRVRFHPVTLQVREAPGWSARDLDAACDWLNDWSDSDAPARLLSDDLGEHLEPYVEQVIDLPSWVRLRGRHELLIPQQAQEERQRGTAQELVGATSPASPIDAKRLREAQEVCDAAVSRRTRGRCGVDSVAWHDGALRAVFQVGQRRIEVRAQPRRRDSTSFLAMGSCEFVYHSEAEALSRPHSELLALCLREVWRPLAQLVQDADQQLGQASTGS